MSLDNNKVEELKNYPLGEDQLSSQPKMPRCRPGSSSPPLKPSDPISTASLFTPRAFPPPSLSGVPVDYIMDQLHTLASQYWDKPDTADCTLVIPVPHARGKAGFAFPDMPAFSMSSESGLGRRVTEPALNSVPRISLKLHVDYLSAHSTFLRGLFSGASTLDLISSAALSEAPSRPSPSGQFSVPENRLPRLMPCSPDHPILFLPIPDPSSIHLLVHWMYFGSTSYIEDGLNNGSVEWEGIARNVEYLGLPAEIKVFLGRWYASWLHAQRGGRYGSDEEEEDDDEADTETVYYSDDDDQSDDAEDSSPAPASVDLNAAIAADDTDDAPKRGRTRTTRPLSTSSASSI
ncbi:hypothetical protein MVEN_02017000 [Mycena venus]|uniref:BTB domain-containing protein n=1 Tax=Mycena venus TaxID=2733690 RepID=A0A8H6XBE0_9AGAR|nr:hypothetical protein MVEN_02017000 [Mycena venus]